MADRRVQFICESDKKHGGKYDYSDVNYINAHTKVAIKCKEHGIFLQSPNSHKRGAGCPKCSGNARLDNDVFINKLKKTHGGKYDYSKVVYKNSHTKIKIVCPKHGLFEQSPTNHLCGKGCPKCANETRNITRKLDGDEFISRCSEAHGDIYNYEKVKYVDYHTKVLVTCKIHGDFEVTPANHLANHHCPKCSCFGPSKPEIEIFDFINEVISEKVESSYRNLKDVGEIDIFIKDKNIGVEFNGLYWHSDQFKDKYYHANKTKLCRNYGISLLQIMEDEWRYKRSVCENIILTRLGMFKSIYARNCVVEEISYEKAKQFIEEHHMQGDCVSKIRYGLLFDGELVSVMTFGENRKSLGSKKINSEYELLRYCNKSGYRVVGGASRLLKHFERNHNPKKITSYANLRWSNGDMYVKLGFEYIGDTEPNYFYVKNGKRYGRFSFRKDILVKQGFDENKTEKEIMSQRGYKRIYDCGSKKFIKTY